MECYLMHKGYVVARLQLNKRTSAIEKVIEVCCVKRIPVGVNHKKGAIVTNSLNNWWKSRSIPASRQGISNVLKSLGEDSTLPLAERAFGLSLTDYYWIKPEASSMEWENINFFQNDFSEDMGELLFGLQIPNKSIDFISPNSTLDGWLKKKWKIVDGKRILVKGGSGTVHQETYNEVIASVIAKRLGFNHVDYKIIFENEKPYSVCENFLENNLEFIPAWNVYQVKKRLNHVSLYQHYMDCAKLLGIPGLEQSLAEMLVLDFLIANEDRHFGNFGVLRNVDTLEWLGAAPLFDNGTSLWYSLPTGRIASYKETKSRPFRENHQDQIKLVTDFSFVNLVNLEGLSDDIKEIARDSVYLEEHRVNAICSKICKRIAILEQMM